MSNYEPSSVREAWVALRRHRGKASLVAGTVVIAAIGYLLVASRYYRSESKLLVRIGRENATLDATATLGLDPVVAVPQLREDEINSVAEVVGSRATIEKVVDRLGPEAVLSPTNDADALVTADGAAGWWQQARRQIKRGTAWLGGALERAQYGAELTPRDRAIATLTKNLRVQPARKSNVIQVTYDAKSPELAQRVAACLVDQFLAEHVRLNRNQGSHEFFTTQTAELRDALHRCEDQLRKLKNATGLVAPEEQRRLLVTRLSGLEESLMRAESARAVAAAKVDALHTKLKELPATQVTAETNNVGNVGADNMRNQLYALEMQEQEAAAKYTADHPKLQELRRRLADAREVFAKEERVRTQTTKGPDRLFEEAQSQLLAAEPQLASLKAEADKLRGQVVDIRSQLQTLNSNEVQIANLQREAALYEASYKKYSTNLEEARIDTALEDQRMSNISVAEAATFDVRPVSPRVALVLGLMVLLSVGGGVGTALAANRWDRSFRSSADMEEHLAIPSLAAIPRFTRDEIASLRN